MSAILSTSPPEKRLFSRGRMLFVIGLVLVVGIALIAWRSTRHFLKTADRVAHSREILETQEKVLRNLMEMESARRGFLISGDERILQDFDFAGTLLMENFNQLRQLTSEDRDLLPRLEQISSLLTESLARQRADIDARRQGNSTELAQLLLAASASARVNKDILTKLNDLEERERMRLSTRAATTDFVGLTVTLIIIGGSAIAVLVLVAAGAMIARDFAARRRAEIALAEQARLLTDIIDTVPEIIFLKDTKGRYIIDNRAHRRYLGVHPGENVKGLTASDVYPKDIAARHTQDDHYVLNTGAPIRNQEEAARPAAPNIHWLSTTKIPLRDGGGHIVGLVGVSVDITKRKTDEQKLKSFAAQLERSNAELQSFASVASHDLQEPLRKIQAFGDRLRTKCAAQLGSQGLDYLSRMENAAQRMQTLIQDLLQLSRITSRAQPFQPCNLGSIVREVMTDLEVRIEQSQAGIEVGDLPTIDADPLQMRQLFQNLIANALKFHRPDVPPIVSISAEILDSKEQGLPSARPTDRCVQITVKDNGIGFDAKFAEQIFVVFQRLHTKQEYDGTGIGLAVCRKITDRHGGTIVAQSAENEGAMFVITLPVNQPADPKLTP